MKSYNHVIDLSSITGRCIEIEESKLVELMRELLSLAVVDEAWYLNRYPDVANAIKAGGFCSGKEHYIRAGYFENRLPRPITVDEKWYLETYPDVAEAVRANLQSSASSHFLNMGFLEGRLPHAGWSVLWDQKPIVAETDGVIKLLNYGYGVGSTSQLGL